MIVAIYRFKNKDYSGHIYVLEHDYDHDQGSDLDGWLVLLHATNIVHIPVLKHDQEHILV